MGSWCGTDGITQLPINHGDKIRLFVLASQDYWRCVDGGKAGGGTCYTTDLWAPIGPSIQGEYNDYGSIENIVKNTACYLIENKIKSDWLPYKRESEYRTEEISSVQDEALEDIISLINQDKGKLKPFASRVSHLGIFMILDDVYQDLIKYNPVVTHSESNGYRYVKRTDSLYLEFKTWYNFKVQAMGYSAAGEELRKALFELDVTSLFNYSERRFMAICKEPLSELATQQIPFEDTKVQDIVQPMIEIALLNAAMSDARKMWHPQCGMGSQQDELDVYKIINKSVERIISAREKEYAENDSYTLYRDEDGFVDWQREHNLKMDQEANRTTPGRLDKDE